ncbi:MAG TPA: DNA primase [Geobacteraceae bacterium]|nr:DNA primase [Geobacteraceae bacterium]
MIPDDKVQEVRERAAILDVVAEYVNLRKSGANYLGLCPFHGEKTPSFNVNPGRAIFHCFGCGVGGNVFSFIMKMEGLTFPEAVKFLAKRVGVTIEERIPSAAEKQRIDERETLYRITELAMRFYRRILREDPAGETGRRYLDRRGVAETTAEAYQLGFAPDRWDSLTRFLERQRVPLEVAEKLGLVRQRESGGYYDLFRNRLLFTIADPYGKPVGFGGRVLDDTLPKYINSPESPIYHKSDILFGIDLAKQSMREKDAAIIVEGYFDHLALYQAGVRNAVATCGTALTTGHLKLLRRYAGMVYTLFDSDAAGKKATFRAMELFLEGGVPASVVELPAGDDPDSFLGKEGSAAFTERVAIARPIFDYYIRDILASSDTASVGGKVKVIDELVQQLKKIANPVERDLYLREIARLLGESERTLRQVLGGNRAPAAALQPSRGQTQRRTGTEDMLLALMGKYPEVSGKVDEYGVANLFSADLIPVAEAILRQIRIGGDVDWGLILEQVEVPEERNRLAALFVRDEHLEGISPLKMFDDLRRSREKEALRRIKDLKRELASTESGSSRYMEILGEINSLCNKKSQLQ